MTRAFDPSRILASCSDGAVAIVGIGCRFAGGIDSPGALWRALEASRDLVGEVPDGRRLALALEDFGVRPMRGGFLADVEGFDAPFFDVSPREAAAMDPQQRLCLETAWHALEDAGIPAHRRAERRIGVFVGAMWQEHDLLQARRPQEISAFTATGTDGSVIAARVAYALGLRGPALTVGTASSSSLVAVHLALQALREDDAEVALAGGVNLVLSAYSTAKMARLGTMAADGRCKAFDRRADGYVRAEGIGLVVLKPLARAERDGDRIYAVIRGSAVNNDGASESLTAPRADAQEELLRRAYARAGIAPAEVAYVEAHGTGTPLGDAVEAEALARVLGAGRAPERPLRIGSVKTNLGHTEAAAGVAGLIKAALAVHHGVLPASLHFEEAAMPLSERGLCVQTQREPWRSDDRPRRAGVSSFGFGGTSCHVVLEEAPARAERILTPERMRLPLLISGADAWSLRAQATRWAEWLESREDWVAVVRASATRRTHLKARASIVASDAGEAAEALRALARGEAHKAVREGTAAERGGVVFVFPGQGSQWVGMGRALMAESPVFRDAVRALDPSFEAALGAASLEHVETVQPALFAMAVGLAAVWRSWGVEPTAVVGHSQGEFAAAYVAGALSAADACRLVKERSALVRRARGGAMAVIELPCREVEARLAPYGGAVSIAAVNTAESTGVSGEAPAVEALLAALEAEGVFARKINIDYASHSRQVEPLLAELRGALAGIAPRAAAIPFVSTVTGAELAGEALDAEYWCRNLREPVRLDRALKHLSGRVFVEVSAHPVLTMPLSGASAGVVVGSLRRDEGQLSTLREVAAALHVQGVPIDWARVLPPSDAWVDLPTYAFPRKARGDALEPRDDAWAARLAGVPAHARDAQLLVWMSREIAAVVGNGEVAPDVPLRDAGLRSPGAVELAARLQQRVGRAITPSFVFRHPTARLLARAVDAMLGPAAVASAAPEPPPIAVSDDDLFASIDALLDAEGAGA